MRVALVQPQNLVLKGKWKERGIVRSPLNLASMAAFLKQKGHSVTIYDFGADSLEEHTWFQHVGANLSEVSDRDLLEYQQKAFDEFGN